MKSDDDRIDRGDPKTALDMDGELNFDCCKTPKAVMCHKMPMFEQLSDQFLVDSK